MPLISEIERCARSGAHERAIELAQIGCVQFGQLFLLQSRFAFRSRWAFRDVEKVVSELPMPWPDDEEGDEE
ncbi:MAG: hypothetical protein C4583_15600 [Anaerolineaceae bacterium]|nr:MAG: hypothetical protein C4583_15600 [Anaerolineaceae bacterium]